MQREINERSASIVPTISDILRLWVSLHTEYGKDLAIKIEPMPGESGMKSLAVSISSQELPAGGFTAIEHVWAITYVYEKNYNISYTRLFDLLIHAYYSLREDKPI